MVLFLNRLELKENHKSKQKTQADSAVNWMSISDIPNPVFPLFALHVHH